MGLGIFHRRRKFASVSAAPPTEQTANTVALRVLVDSGPAQRELFAIRVSADEPVEAIRSAIAQHTGIASMSLFKVSIPWQAYYEAGAHAERQGASASMLSAFVGFNIDDASQLTAANGGVRGRRRSVRCGKPCPSVRDWFPDGSDGEHIDVLARSASSSSLDWTKTAPATPLTFCVRFASIDGSFSMSSGLTVVDIAPDASVAELKVAILLAAGRPAPAGLLEALVLWRVDMSEAELEDLDARGGLTRGRQPQPKAGFPSPTLLGDDEEPVAHYFPNYHSDVRSIALSAWVHPAAAHELAPRPVEASGFTYAVPEPSQTHFEPAERLLGPLPIPAPLPVPTPLAAAITIDADCAALGGDDVAPTFCDPFAAPRPSPSTCCSGHADLDLTTGFGSLGGAGGLIGLGISFAPMSCRSPSDSSHSSLEEEVPSWPPTPDCSGSDGWLPPGPEFVAVRKQDWEVDVDARTEIPSMPTPKLAPEPSFFIPLQTTTL